jgi:hypothetical protein
MRKKRSENGEFGGKKERDKERKKNGMMSWFNKIEKFSHLTSG